jgi:prolyl-tRNA synthetase
MMQDGKALQAGTSHYLGTGFAEAAGIRYQDKEGQQTLCHTTSWGVSTRMIGGVIMTHGDDDGLRVPPQVAPQQIVILPMLRDNDGDEALLAYCEGLRARWRSNRRSASGARAARQAPRQGDAKRWAWVKKGVPLMLEIGGRDAEGGRSARCAATGCGARMARSTSWRRPRRFRRRGGGRAGSDPAGLFAEAQAKRDAQISAA